MAGGARVTAETMEPIEASDLESVALQACLLAYNAREWQKLADLVDAWEQAKGHVPALAALWRGRAAFWAQDYIGAYAWTRKAYPVASKLERVDRIAVVSQMGEAMARLGHFGKARTFWKDALALGEGVTDPATVTALGHLRLSITDQWERGWGDQEARLALDPRYGIPEGCTAWDGKAQGRIGVLHEQGIGDGVLFARFFPWVAGVSGCRPVYFGPDVLTGWMEGLDGVEVGVVGEWTPDHGIDYVVRMGSLATLAGVHRPSKASQFPPVAPNALHILHRERPRHEVVVGVCWRGEANGHHAFERNLTAEQFAPVWEPTPGVRFVNLCHGADVPDGAPFARVDFRDTMDSGTAIAACDLVVSVDTAVVHLAGSLGIPTVCLTPTVPDWRYDQWPWGTGSVWYDSVSVARRDQAANVEGVVRAGRFAVEMVSQARQNPHRRAA